MASSQTDPRSPAEVYASFVIIFLLFILRGFYLINFLMKSKRHLSLSNSDKFTRATLIYLAIAFVLDYIYRVITKSIQLDQYVQGESKNAMSQQIYDLYEVTRFSRALSYALQNCGFSYNIARWFILIETLKNFGNDNSKRVDRTFKALILLSIGFLIYGLVVIWLSYDIDK